MSRSMREIIGTVDPSVGASHAESFERGCEFAVNAIRDIAQKIEAGEMEVPSPAAALRFVADCLSGDGAI